MKRRAARFRNIHVILATSACLVLLVAGTLGWLGWRLLSQEETLLRQQTHNRLEQNADLLLAGFLRRMTETEATLSRIGSAIPANVADSPQATGAVLVTFSQTGVATYTAGQLLYYPALPPAPVIDTALFAEAQKLEFQAGDLKAAASALLVLAESKDAPIRSEALLRLARVQSKNGQRLEALASYAKLADEQLMNSLGEAPYGLLSRFRRCQILTGSGQPAAARAEASALLTGLESAQWPLSKESYAYYTNEAGKLADGTSERPVVNANLDTKLAVAE